MEYDRASSYGRKKQSDPANSGYGESRDDSSLFSPREASSLEHINPSRPSAGYNRDSFRQIGRQEPVKGGPDEEQDAGEIEAWDVYADFNNTGPRYSSAFETDQPQTQGGYSKLPPAPMIARDEATEGKVEMVTVPALGPEWGKDEMYQMTKTARKEQKRDDRNEFWKAWNRDQRGLCGRYFTRRVLVFFLFGLCCVIGVILSVTIPRVPGVGFNSGAPIINATGSWAKAVPTIFSRAPTNFSFPAFASLQFNTQSNYLPIKFTRVQASVYDLDTNILVGTGDTASFSIPAKSFPEVSLPLNFTYFTSNSTDQTWTDFYDACKNKATYVDGQRTPLKLILVLYMNILGLPTQQQTTIQVSNANCPVELSLNSV